MSLNGLDAPAIQEASEYASQGEPGRWCVFPVSFTAAVGRVVGISEDNFARRKVFNERAVA